MNQGCKAEHHMDLILTEIKVLVTRFILNYHERDGKFWTERNVYIAQWVWGSGGIWFVASARTARSRAR